MHALMLHDLWSQPCRSMVAAHAGRHLCTASADVVPVAQVVEYAEDADAGGGHKQDYFVELWDVGAPAGHLLLVGSVVCRCNTKRGTKRP